MDLVIGCWDGGQPLHTTLTLHHTLITLTMLVTVLLLLTPELMAMGRISFKNMAVVLLEQCAVVNTVIVHPPKVLPHTFSRS